ncbi:PstS family phosphate ABC transporter substrate-binding protein [Aminipila luticellarii]|uniref:PBP domain-containing protein n=1 Tax=Aminipila luticellarii TaxID=2507160 RepID=A0A410PU22_9FIRM|nr:substrate-binding domain-containing protein [Aminipila luticellarii]QAT42452.1 hypothetical protein EQM06_03970 [Aminipila luticellarii]
MVNNSKDAIEEEAFEIKKTKKSKQTPEEKAVKNKQKVERAANARVRRAEAQVRRAEQASRDKEKSSEKKQKEKDKKASNKIKAQEKKVKQKEKKQAQKETGKIKKQEKKEKLEAQKMQKKAELAARTPLQKRVDRKLKMKRILPKVIVLLALGILVFVGVRFGSQLIHFAEEKFPAISSLHKTDSDKKAEKSADQKTEKADEETAELYIGGNTALKDFYSEALKEFLGSEGKETEKYCSAFNTGDAYKSLIAGKQDLILAAPPTEKELEMAKKAKLELQKAPVLNGGFVFLVHKDNPVESLTMPQLKGIYSGTITNWKELGGKDEPIVAYQRAENTGSQRGMYQYVVKKEEIMKTSIKMKVGDTEAVVKDISSEKGGIGYSYYYYVARLKNKNDVKMIAVNGVEPAKETIEYAQYPLTTYTYVVIAEKEDGSSMEGTKEEERLTKIDFIRWLLSEDGQKLAEKKGFIKHSNR